jgi:hypothetical protein
LQEGGFPSAVVAKDFDTSLSPHNFINHSAHLLATAHVFVVIFIMQVMLRRVELGSKILEDS